MDGMDGNREWGSLYKTDGVRQRRRGLPVCRQYYLEIAYEILIFGF